MTPGKTKSLYRGILFVLFIAGIFALAPAVKAQTDEPESGGLPAHYPEEFDGKGRIDEMRGNEVVIDDMLLQFTSYALFHTPEYADISRDIFERGNYVGYVLNDRGEIECMCLLDEDMMGSGD